MKKLTTSASLPLGVDIGAEFVSIVASDASADGFVVRETKTLEVPSSDGTSLDLKIAETLRALLAAFATKERRCVLAAPSGEVVTRVFRIPPKMRRSEADRAASLEADSIVDWPISERLVALDPIPGKTDEMLLSIARNSTIERLVAIARAYVADPDLLVLDEATSAVDPATEVRLNRALDSLTRGRTTITIAHRLSTAEAADEVLVVQRGAHRDLVDVPGPYQRLHDSWVSQSR